MFHAVISQLTPHSPRLYSTEQKISLYLLAFSLQPSFFGMIHRERRNEVMFSHLSPHHAAARKPQGESIVYGIPSPPYQAAAQAQKGEYSK